jgi:hypothetical protein
MKKIFAIAATLGLSLSTAAADTVDSATLKDSFAFNGMKPEAKCKKVTKATLKKIKKFTCEPATSDRTIAGPVATASQRPALAECDLKKGDSVSISYLFFANLDDCENERTTQLANAE